MQRSRLARRAGAWTALACCTFILAACQAEQVELGEWNTFYTPHQAACPVLQWQFLANAQRSIGGFLLTANGGARLANLSGTLNQDDTFQMTATAIVGNQTSTVTGRFSGTLTTVTIHGDIAGSACNGQTFKLRFMDFYGPRAFGGGG